MPAFVSKRRDIYFLLTHFYAYFKSIVSIKFYSPQDDWEHSITCVQELSEVVHGEVSTSFSCSMAFHFYLCTSLVTSLCNRNRLRGRNNVQKFLESWFRSFILSSVYLRSKRTDRQCFQRLFSVLDLWFTTAGCEGVLSWSWFKDWLMTRILVFPFELLI